MAVLKILGGVFVAIANSQGGGGFLGFYPPDGAGHIGFDIAKIAFYYLAGWLIYRGYRGFRPVAKPAPEGPCKGVVYTQTEIEDFKRRGLM
jgi:hypothetical protein